jgi:2,4-dienoyl-CoA reductase-like NADH-dependent reductase (Old Yellow Enzyme family)/thioredoxin reductase
MEIFVATSHTLKINREKSKPMFNRIFSPGKIGNLEIKNRLIKPAQHMMTADEKGFVTPLQLKLYSDWAKGGVGLIIVEMSAIDFVGAAELPMMLMSASDEYIPGLATLAKAIKDNGARAGCQVCHGGGCKVGEPSFAPSKYPYVNIMGMQQESREMTEAEIEETIENYGQAAGRAKKAGFELVEIHMAHGYLPDAFFSQKYNLRTDKWGGSLENRMRFPVEVLKRVKKYVGKDFPVSCRISGTEWEEGGITLVDSIPLAQALEKNGADAINVSSAGAFTHYRILVTQYYPRGVNVFLAEAIKKSGGIKVPVICNGAITVPEVAEDILAAGKADFVAIGRPLWADPEWPNKAREGRVLEIRPCVRQNISCAGAAVMRTGVLHCSVNPEFNQVYEGTMDKVANPKKVAVIGAGPGGLEAAWTAAIKGHKVTLFEKRNVLGGNMVEDSVPQFRVDKARLLSYFENEMKRLGVTVKHEEATADTILKGKFDAVIAATGTKRSKPKLRGIDKPIAIDFVEALQGKMKGNNIVILGTDYEIRCVDVALYANELNKKATLLFPLETERELAGAIGAAESAMECMSIMEILPGIKNISIQLGVEPVEITDRGVVVERNGKKETIPADTVVYAPEFTVNDDLAKALEKKGVQVEKVGDCVEPMRLMRDAIHEGHAAAKKLQ